jgi:hypothetical protein
MSDNHSQTPLAIFFEAYNFQKYKYDPSNTPTEEFARLCTARRWGPEKANKARILFENALKLSFPEQKAPNANPELIEFFKKYEFKGFSFNPADSVEAEFKRLCEARKWGEKNLKKVGEEFKKALNPPASTIPAKSTSAKSTPAKSTPAKSTPTKPTSKPRDNIPPPPRPDLQHHTSIAAFFLRQNCPGYTYKRRSPEIEFNLLKKAHREKWKKQNPKDKENYNKSEEFWCLRREFHAAVEDRFNWLLKVKRGTVREEELKPWEILVELFRVGKAPMKREDAEKVRYTCFRISFEQAQV